MTRRRWYAAGVLVAIAGLLLYLLLPQRPWEVRLVANTTSGTPWSTFELEARVEAWGSRTVKVDGWRWRWTADGGELPGDGPGQSWRSGRQGRHRVSVAVTSPAGRTRTASVELDVRAVPYVDQSRFPRTRAPESQPDPSRYDVPFGFSDVIVEKRELCVGEPTLIRASVTAKSGWTGNLIPVIAGRMGTTGYYSILGGRPGMHRVVLTVRDPAIHDRFAEEEVYIELKDCYASASILLEATSDPGVPNRYSFMAKLVKFERGGNGRRISDDAAAYSWDFGDGTRTVTREFETAHVFPDESQRPANENYHGYLVTVEALDGRGAVLAKGYESVFFYNLRRLSKHSLGLVELVSHYRDFPDSDGKGNKSLAVTLENIDDEETVTLTELKLRNLACDETTQTETTAPVSSVFPTTTIGPRQRVTGTLTVAEPEKHDLCRIFATVTGRSTPRSLDATGAFAVTVGEAFRTPISDDGQLELVKQVTRLLGKASFTQEDVRRLEDEGKIPRGALQPPPAAQSGARGRAGPAKDPPPAPGS